MLPLADLELASQLRGREEEQIGRLARSGIAVVVATFLF
jgi:hypothetical protein